MKIVIPGGSGQIGGVLRRYYESRGDEVVILSRNAGSSDPSMVSWDGRTLGPWVESLKGADVVINLAGRSVNCRYNSRNQQAILDSRVESTRAVGEAISTLRQAPRVWLQSSTATIYAHTYDRPNDEASGTVGEEDSGAPDKWKFSIEVAKRWESATDEFESLGTRIVKMRSAMTMSPDRGGVFDTLLGLTKKGLGGASGDGRQWVSWIHERDFIRALDWMIERDHLKGAINIASPNPLPNREFMRELRRAWGNPFGAPATPWMLEVGARLLKTETELVLKSRRVVPGILLDDGFKFEFPNWSDAAKDLCDRSRGLAPGSNSGILSSS